MVHSLEQLEAVYQSYGGCILWTLGDCESNCVVGEDSHCACTGADKAKRVIISHEASRRGVLGAFTRASCSSTRTAAAAAAGSEQKWCKSPAIIRGSWHWPELGAEHVQSRPCCTDSLCYSWSSTWQSVCIRFPTNPFLFLYPVLLSTIMHQAKAGC
jgi:hypothetical protein